MNLFRRLAAVLGALTLVLAISPAISSIAFADANHAVGHVYVNDNSATANTVSVFDRLSDGSLTQAAGSPVAIGGAGTGAPLGSQGAVQLTADKKFLLAVDAASNQVSVLRVHGDGSLSSVPGSPFDSGGDNPVSIAIHGRLVYVANSGGADANYTGFALSNRGALRPIAGSTYSLPSGTVVGDILINPTGTHLAATRVDTKTLPSEIDSFTIDRHGRLRAAPGSPFAAESIGPFGSDFRPTAPDQLFVSNAHAGAGNGTISAYTVRRNGALLPIGPSPYPDTQTAPCWVTISRTGRYLYAVNTAVPSITRFWISKEGSLSFLGNTQFNDPTGLRPFDAGLSPDGKNLYVVDAGLGAVSSFAVGPNGSLSELAGSPTVLTPAASPFGIAVS
ncbi:MAG TPA: beta-propeller fold lactonase family protein [Chloroflexota bacterium]|jgi:6-phosphogluconolactonase (cycloisomerase 2 family)|nr:beta-propeller fold lactonase family protein [Chloroflexota bacterium]